MKIIELEEVDSTIEYIKRNSFEEDTIVFAKRQSGGKGTKGRSFSSNEGGVYLSVFTLYENFPAKNAFKIMINSAVAVAKTIEHFGVEPTIKWSNDVLVNGKKICGILIENSLSSAYICHSIVGIGVNISNTLPDELSEIATSMRAELNYEISIDEFKKVLVKNLQKKYSLNTYKSYMPWLGGDVLLRTDIDRVVRAVDVASDGSLVVESNGKLEKISSAEVSLKLK